MFDYGVGACNVGVEQETTKAHTRDCQKDPETMPGVDSWQYYSPQHSAVDTTKTIGGETAHHEACWCSDQGHGLKARLVHRYLSEMVSSSIAPHQADW